MPRIGRDTSYIHVKIDNKMLFERQNIERDAQDANEICRAFKLEGRARNAIYNSVERRCTDYFTCILECTVNRSNKLSNRQKRHVYFDAFPGSKPLRYP